MSDGIGPVSYYVIEKTDNELKAEIDELKEKYNDLTEDFETLKDVKNNEIAELKKTSIMSHANNMRIIAELKEALDDAETVIQNYENCRNGG